MIPQTSRLELLAPAGSPEAGHAALDFGADAIYLGLKKFSARTDASNFTHKELSEIVAYAHSLKPRRKVYVAVNTLVYEDELDEIIETLSLLSELEVDGIIVQDLGVAKIAKDHFPELRLHASTQMAIHNLEGAIMAKKLGFFRVTLARELALSEIREIIEKSGIEIEVFIHGAMCYSYSGLCLFSGMVRKRSGNRGECAQVCREVFKWGEKGKEFMPFSMRDLATTDLVRELQKIGVVSMKIEGRKKNALYVAAVTDFYRKLLNGEISSKEARRMEDDIKTIFSRPWTEAYYRSSLNREVIDPFATGHRGVQIGKIQKIFKTPGRKTAIRFVTARPLERHDGLQIEIPGHERPFGFPVEFFQKDKDKKIFQVPANSVVEVIIQGRTPKLQNSLPIFCSSSQEVKRKYLPKISKPGKMRVTRKLNFKITLAKKNLAIKAAVRGRHSSEKDLVINYEISGNFRSAKNPQEMEKTSRETFGKLGGTGFQLGSFDFNNPYKVFIPASSLNKIRRQIIDELSGKADTGRKERISQVKSEVGTILSGKEKEDKQQIGCKLDIKVDNLESLSLLSAESSRNIGEIIIDISEESFEKVINYLSIIGKFAGRKNIRLALPVITRSWERENLAVKIQRFLAMGWEKWQVSNLSGFEILYGFQRVIPWGVSFDISTDWQLYVTNRLAAQRLFDLGATRVTLSPENKTDNLELLVKALGERASIIAYQDIPLFTSESCPNAAVSGKCLGKPKCRFDQIEIKSKKLGKFIVISRNCRTIVIRSEPFDMAREAEKLKDAGASHFRLDLINKKYTPKEAAEVLKSISKQI